MPCHNLATSGQPETRLPARASAPWLDVPPSISRFAPDLLLRLSPERRLHGPHLLLRLSE